MKTLLVLATAAFVFPLTILPNSVENCADSSWVFATNMDTEDNLLGAKIAKAQFCSVVATNYAMWN